MDKFVKMKDVSDRCEVKTKRLKKKVKTEHTMKPTKSSTKKAKVRQYCKYCKTVL